MSCTVGWDLFLIPPDCNGDPGGGAEIDDCNECVGGNTGKEACDPCTEIGDLISEIYGDDSTSPMAVRASVQKVTQSDCCGEGYIKRNGVCVPWADIKSENGITVDKHYFDHAVAVAYLYNQSQTMSSISDLGLDLFPGSATAGGFLIDKLIDLISKIKGLSKANYVCTIMIGTHQFKYSVVSEMYDDLVNYYINDDRFKQKGLYTIKSTRYQNSLYGYGTLVTVDEIFSSDGCLIGTIGY